MVTETQQVNETIAQIEAALAGVKSVLALGAGNNHGAWIQEIHTSVSALANVRDGLQEVQNALTFDLVEIVGDS